MSDHKLCNDVAEDHDWQLTEAANWFTYYQCRKCGATAKVDNRYDDVGRRA